MSKQRLHAIVSGRVQGVNFRATTQSKASQLNITGHVRNKADGTVEVVAEGEQQKLQQLLNWLGKGPTAARVSSVDADWQDASGEYSGFNVRH